MAYDNGRKKRDERLLQNKDELLSCIERYDIRLPSIEKMRQLVGQHHDVTDDIILLRYINAWMYNIKR